MLRILFALGSILAAASSDAATLRYQGELLDRNAPANERYDLRLTPYSGALDKHALAPAVTFEDVLVEDGFFLLEPEFGAAIDGRRDVWIELAVRDADSPLAFATIKGRQKAMLAPLVGQCWSTTGDSGVNPGINFLGTTDGAPLVLRSSGGIGINTSDPRDLLTLRGANSYLDGPTINLSGTASDQAESGRIRFVEGTAAGNFRGAYVRYDGASNLFAIGAHNNSDNLPSSEVDQIVMLRSATTRVGIGKAPTEELDVAGDIRIDGGLKFENRSEHWVVVDSREFQERGSDNCDAVVSVKKSSNPFASDCAAQAVVRFPDGARITALAGLFFMSSGSQTGDCQIRLRREFFDADGTTQIIATAEGAGEAGDSFDEVSGLGALVNNQAQTYNLQAVATTTQCSIGSARITYTLPNGFIP